MYEQLKNDMRKAGIPVSEGNDLAQSDLQLVRDYCYFAGISLNGDDFLAYVSPSDAGESLTPGDNSTETVGSGETTETVEDQELSISEESSVPEAPVIEKSPESSVTPEANTEDANEGDEHTEHTEQTDANDNEGAE